MKPFDEDVEDINDYIERLKRYFTTKKTERGPKMSAFITVMSSTMRDKVKDLLAPTKLEEVTFEQLQEVLQRAYRKKKILVAERFRFFKRDQLKNESITDYVNAIKQLAVTCQFGSAILEDYLRDKFICGLRDEKIQANLLTKEDLTFNMALRDALSQEVHILQPQVIIKEVQQKHKENGNNFEGQANSIEIEIKDELQPFELQAEFEAQGIFDLKLEEEKEESPPPPEEICENKPSKVKKVSKLKQRLKKNSKHSDKSKKFVCGFCYVSFERHTHLQRHIRRHTGEKPYSCKICKASFTRNYCLQQHVKKFHPEEFNKKEILTCDICGDEFTEKIKLQRHLNKHDRLKRFVCEVCSRFFSRRGHLERHVLSHTGEKPFTCDICNDKFLRRESWLTHVECHSGERKYSCEICGNAFLRKSSLRQHLLTHTAARPFSCTLCDKTFTRKSHLQRHTRTHTGEKSFLCELCDYRCAEKANLLVHVRRHKARESKIQTTPEPSSISKSS